jgi:hypothetical protein
MQYRKPRISRVIYPHAFAHFETQSPSEKKGRPADRLSCIIEVRNSLKGEHMAAEERIGAQSTFSRVILHATVSSGFVAAYLRGILDVNSRKGYRQSGRLAGFGSQERSLMSVSVVTESGGVEVRNLQRVLPISTLFADSTTLLVACVATLGLSGCLVAGYSSGGGWFVWPGSLGLLIVVLLVVFLMRRRYRFGNAIICQHEELRTY